MAPALMPPTSRWFHSARSTGVDSLGEVSAIIYFLGGPKLFLPVLALLLAAAGFAAKTFLL